MARQVLALDTEDNSKGDVTIINFYDGYGHTSFTGASCRMDAWDWLVKAARRRPVTVWACNVEYDLQNVFGEWLGKLCTLQYVSAGLMRGTMRDARVMFLDTLRHWPMTVKQMGRYLGLPKLERNFRSLEYCQRDTEIVYRFVMEMLIRYECLGVKVRATLPAIAVQFWQYMFYQEALPVIPNEQKSFFRQAYFGGRNEVYVYRTPVPGPVHHYDVNSLFPYVMRERQYPDLAEWTPTRRPNLDREGVARVVVYIPESNLPALPMRGVFNEVVFAYGRQEGTWTYPEIRQALADGAVVERVESAIEFPRTVAPFVGYVDFCYHKRHQSGTDLDKQFWKLMMNSLYGKFGQGGGMEVIYNDRLLTIETGGSAYANVVWAAYVTAYARLHLLSLLRACPHVYYTDTDSVFTSTPQVVGTGLGELKQEGIYHEAYFAGNKAYVLDGQAKAKGVKHCDTEGHPDDCTCLALEYIRTGRCVYRKPVRFRESRRTGAKQNEWLPVEKRLLADYTKRRVLADGVTIPWRWTDYQKEMFDGTL